MFYKHLLFRFDSGVDVSGTLGCVEFGCWDEAEGIAAAVTTGLTLDLYP